MKILFYLEPHPIRERGDSFNWIARLVLKMIRDETRLRGKPAVEMRLLVSDFAKHGLLKDHPELTESFLYFSDEEEKYIKSCLGKWDDNAVEEWQKIMQGIGQPTEIYVRALERIKHFDFDFDYIVYWGTNGAVRKFAANNSVISVAMEQGVTRSPFIETIYFDPFGANGDSYVCELDVDLIERRGEYGQHFGGRAKAVRTRR